MTGTKWNFDPENKIDSKIGTFTIVGTIIFFGLLNIVVNAIGKPRRVKADAWRWNNLFISWVHGLIIGIWDILCFVYYPEFLDDLIFHINYFTYTMVAMSTGYFVYDFIDMMYNGQLGPNWEVAVHHIAVTSMFYFDIHSKMCLGYNVLALMAEINSFFLHSRKLLQMLEVDYSHWLYRTVCYVNLVTFASCRGWSCSRIVYGMFIEGHMVPPMYFYVLCVSMFIMCGINLVLFWRLFKNDVVRYWRESSKSHEKTAHLNGNNNQPKHVKSS